MLFMCEHDETLMRQKNETRNNQLHIWKGLRITYYNETSNYCSHAASVARRGDFNAPAMGLVTGQGEDCILEASIDSVLASKTKSHPYALTKPTTGTSKSGRCAAWPP
jgi:hypothetical protein